MKISIESLGNHAVGVAHYKGKVCFVPYTAPGDEVLVDVIQSHKSYTVCRLIDILQASSLRSEPICPYYGKCGGCQLQHITYDAQCSAKEDILHNTVDRLYQDDVCIAPIVQSPDVMHYRNSVRLHRGRNRYGYYAPDSHLVIEIEQCSLLSEEINRWLSAIPDNDINRFNHMSIKNDNNGTLIADNRPGRLKYSVTKPVSFSVYADIKTFFQSNTEMIDEWLAVIHRMADIEEHHRILDVYSGTGIIGLSFAPFVQHVDGIEISNHAVNFARQAQHDNQFGNILWHVGSPERIIPTLKPWNTVILDPPRQGVKETVLTHLCRTFPERIIYVSCNHMTWARDAHILKKFGYIVKEVIPFDFFPQTYHFELVSLFERE